LLLRSKLTIRVKLATGSTALAGRAPGWQDSLISEGLKEEEIAVVLFPCVVFRLDEIACIGINDFGYEFATEV